MVATSRSYGVSRIVTGENEAIFVARGGGRGRRGLVVLPGQLQVVSDYFDPSKPYQMAFFSAIQQAGFDGAIIDAGVASWGNATGVADIDLARVYMSSLGCATDKIVLVGASAGAADALNYIRTYPSRVAAFVGVMPAVDLDDMRDNNRASARQYINSAWGMPVGSTSSTDPLPSTANPNTTANAASIASSGAPIKLYYSSGDTVVIPSTVTSFASKLGITASLLPGSVDHSDALFGQVPLTEMVQFIAASM